MKKTTIQHLITRRLVINTKLKKLMNRHIGNEQALWTETVHLVITKNPSTNAELPKTTVDPPNTV